jgi:hypothetical protein
MRSLLFGVLCWVRGFRSTLGVCGGLPLHATQPSLEVSSAPPSGWRERKVYKQPRLGGGWRTLAPVGGTPDGMLGHSLLTWLLVMHVDSNRQENSRPTCLTPDTDDCLPSPARTHGVTISQSPWNSFPAGHSHLQRIPTLPGTSMCPPKFMN